MLKGETEMNLFGKKFALVLALIAVLAMAGSALAVETIYVDAASTAESPSGTADAPYKTINEAVTNAQSGAVIKVAAGEYHFDEPLVINKPLELIGDDNGGTKFTAILGDRGSAEGQFLGNHMIQLDGNIPGAVISNIIFEVTTEKSSDMDMAIIYIAGGGTVEDKIRIENCTFIGNAKTEGEATSVIAVLTPTFQGPANIVLNNNTVDNMKHGFFFNTVGGVEITNNTISNTTHNGININNTYVEANGDIVISDNTLSNIATATGQAEGEDMGIYVGDNDATLNVTDNEINMALNQEKALSDTVKGTQVAQVTITDADRNERNIYHSTLTEAVQSEKTADGSTVTLLAQPTTEDANVKIEKNVTFAIPKEITYEPVVDEGVEVVENEDGTITIVQPSPEPTPEPTPEPAPKPSHSSGGGGCSAGFGALALLAAVPLMFRRKK